MSKLCISMANRVKIDMNKESKTGGQLIIHLV